MKTKTRLWVWGLVLLISLAFGNVVYSLAIASNDAVNPELIVDRTSVEQGDFFVVTVKKSKKKPKVWFNTKEYHSFRSTGEAETWVARIPAENLLKPGSYAIKAKSKKWENSVPVKVLDNHKSISKITLSPGKSGLSPTKLELNKIGSGLHALSNAKLWNDKWVYPSKAPKSSAFGNKRSYNGGPPSSYHKGLDFAADLGSPVVAPAAGKIVQVCDSEEKCGHIHGKFVIMDFGQYVTSIFMHLHKVDVKPGDIVTKGQKIGEVGHTGQSTGPHLHWGVYVSGTSVDPEYFVNRNVQ